MDSAGYSRVAASRKVPDCRTIFGQARSEDTTRKSKLRLSLTIERKARSGAASMRTLNLLQILDKGFGIVDVKDTADPQIRQLLVLNVDLQAIVAIELLNRRSNRVVVQNNPSLHPRRRIRHVGGNGLRFGDRRHSHLLARRQWNCPLRAVCRNADFALNNRDLSAIRPVVDIEFRAYRAYDGEGCLHVKRPCWIVRHSKQGLPLRQFDAPPIFIEVNDKGLQGV